MKHLNSFTVRYLCNNPWIDQKMYQITLCQQHQLVDNVYPVITVDNFNDINNFLDADFLFIQAAGDYIIDRDHVWNKLHNIPSNVGLIGHILWDPTDSTPHLHHQCIIINTKALKGNAVDFHSKNIIGKKFIRSDESLHGNYCPAWVALDDTVSTRDPGFGTDLMSMILDNGFDVVNFDLDWRNAKTIDYLSHMPSRGFFNQDIGTELFSHCLKTLTEDARLDPSQLSAIQVIKNEFDYKIVNVLHWDDYPKKEYAELVICPANGFMGECIAHANHAKKIIFYDVNPNNIDFKRKLYSEWDGKNYEEYYTQFADSKELKTDPFTLDAKQKSKRHEVEVNYIIEHWEEFRNLDVEFIHGDIIEIVDLLLDKVVDHTVLHTSTIFKYYVWSHLKYDLEVINLARNKIEKRMLDTKSIWFET